MESGFCVKRNDDRVTAEERDDASQTQWPSMFRIYATRSLRTYDLDIYLEAAAAIAETLLRSHVALLADPQEAERTW